MSDFIIFLIVFIAQVFLISIYYSKKIADKFSFIINNYSKEEYPKLYPKPVEFYLNGLKKFKLFNKVIFFIGLLLIVLFFYVKSNKVLSNIILFYYLLQILPVILIEIKAYKYFKNLRENDKRTVRKTVMKPRRFFDFISLKIILLFSVVYVLFITFIEYVKQFNFPWFGGYVNLLIITIGNLFFIAVILYNIYGKQLNPYQEYEERVCQIKKIVKILTIMSIAVTVFAVVTISLKMYGLNNLKHVVLSIYFQAITFVSYKVLSFEKINFEVYK